MSNLWTAERFCKLAEQTGKNLGELMFQREVELRRAEKEEIERHMQENWKVMKDSALQAIEQPIPSMGGLIGGEAFQMKQTENRYNMALSGVVRRAVTYALSVMELNAAMGLIVAAPTAGSAGVLPGVLLALQETYDFKDEELVSALFAAGAVGFLINQGATLAGAEGGCQAEVGSAAAMAAAACVQLLGGSVREAFEAASISLINLLGLVCDPVLGLVEMPCQIRNAQGASTALLAAEMILSGMKAPAPLDEMIPILYRVGQSLGPEFRETALGGLATAPSFAQRKKTQGGGCASCCACS